MDLTMRVKLLPAPLLIRGFVHGENDCNYELYLLELLNCSKWFLEYYPGEFRQPESESHGECDAINDSYQLDFKLFASKTALQARSMLAPQIHKAADGVSFYSGSRLSNTSIRTTRLFAAFRGKSISDLIKIRNSSSKAYGIANDIYTALETLETQKNILLFFPYEFTFDISHGYEEAIKSITEALDNDFHSAFLYRDRYASEFETFLTCIYDKEFLIFRIERQKLLLCDSVKLEDVATFSKLINYVDWWD